MNNDELKSNIQKNEALKNFFINNRDVDFCFILYLKAELYYALDYWEEMKPYI